MAYSKDKCRTVFNSLNDKKYSSLGTFPTIDNKMDVFSLGKGKVLNLMFFTINDTVTGMST